MTANTDVPELGDWIPAGSIPKLYPQFDQPTINYLLRERESLGLSEAVRIIGRTRYVNVVRFAAWVENDCRWTRRGGRNKAASDRQSDGQASPSKGSSASQHTDTTRR